MLECMTERARFMATQPGFVSVSLHKSDDGSHIVNYASDGTAANHGPSSASNGRASASASSRRSRASTRSPMSRRR